MINEADLDALLAGRHADPFGRLGLHADDNGRLWVRVLLPGAAQVALLDAGSKKHIVDLEERRGGFFEAQVPRRKHRFDYRLAVSWAGGGEGVYADPYNFYPQLGDDELKAFAEGRNFRPWLSLGAHVVQYGDVSGVRFAVWAPNAKRVSVVGNFNNWDGRRHPMRLRHLAGVWEIFVPHAIEGDLYKFEIVNGNGALLPLKADPYARRAQLRPETASVVAALPEPTPLPRQRERANRRESPISVYEVHAASWRRGVAGDFPTWDELSEHLPAYVADMGFTHVQLMPVSEHPFDGSWGYQTLGMYAPSARFGPPEGFARFVKACHEQGLGRRCPRPGRVRRHAPLRIRRPQGRLPPRLEHADLQLRPHRGARVPDRQRDLLDRALGH
jgi:1,4-alpha-glucan branching enzyme